MFRLLEKKKLILITIGLVLAAMIPLTIYQLQKQQELRGRATGNPVTVSLLPTTGSMIVGELLDVQMLLDGSDNNVDGVDITFDFSKDLVELIEFQSSTTFNNELFKTPTNQANQAGTMRFILASTATTPITGAAIPIGTLRLRGKAEGSASVAFQTVKVRAQGQSQYLPTGQHSTGNYSVTPSTGTTPTPSPTIEPSATLTPPPATPTQPAATPTPTAIPPTPTPCSGCVTFDVRVKLAGIGADGTTSPKRLQRTLIVTLVDENDVETITKSGTVSFDVPTGMFVSTIDMGTVAPGVYTVKAASPGFMRKIIANILDITQGVNRYQITAAVALPAGDLRADNELNIQDYEAFRSCFGAKADTTDCGANKPFADITDDGVVDLVDYKFFFESFKSQQGD